MKWIPATFLAAMMVACSTTPTPADQVQPPTQVLAPELLDPRPGTGEVTILRDQGLTGSGCLHQVKVDGRPVATLDNGEGVTLHLPAGQRLINVDSGRALCPNVALSVDPVVQEGARLVYRLSMASDGALRITRTE